MIGLVTFAIKNINGKIRLKPSEIFNNRVPKIPISVLFAADNLKSDLFSQDKNIDLGKTDTSEPESIRKSSFVSGSSIIRRRELKLFELSFAAPTTTSSSLGNS